MEHRDRQRWVAEVARINQHLNDTDASRSNGL
jgi:hypothetical protein